MKVKATRLGYYDLKRRKVGAVFVLSDAKHFSETWMQKIGAAPSGKNVPKSSKKVDDEESEGNRPTGGAEVI